MYEVEALSSEVQLWGPEVKVWELKVEVLGPEIEVLSQMSGFGGLGTLENTSPPIQPTSAQTEATSHASVWQVSHRRRSYNPSDCEHYVRYLRI